MTIFIDFLLLWPLLWRYMFSVFVNPAHIRLQGAVFLLQDCKKWFSMLHNFHNCYFSVQRLTTSTKVLILIDLTASLLRNTSVLSNFVHSFRKPERFLCARRHLKHKGHKGKQEIVSASRGSGRDAWRRGDPHTTR